MSAKTKYVKLFEEYNEPVVKITEFYLKDLLEHNLPIGVEIDREGIVDLILLNLHTVYFYRSDMRTMIRDNVKIIARICKLKDMSSQYDNSHIMWSTKTEKITKGIEFNNVYTILHKELLFKAIKDNKIDMLIDISKDVNYFTEFLERAFNKDYDFLDIMKTTLYNNPNLIEYAIKNNINPVIDMVGERINNTYTKIGKQNKRMPLL